MVSGLVEMFTGFPCILRRRVPKPFHAVLNDPVLHATPLDLLDGVIAFTDCDFGHGVNFVEGVGALKDVFGVFGVCVY